MPTNGLVWRLCPNVSTTTLWQWSFLECLPVSWTTLRGKHSRHPIALMGVVDTFGLSCSDWIGSGNWTDDYYFYHYLPTYVLIILCLIFHALQPTQTKIGCLLLMLHTENSMFFSQILPRYYLNALHVKHYFQHYCTITPGFIFPKIVLDVKG